MSNFSRILLATDLDGTFLRSPYYALAYTANDMVLIGELIERLERGELEALLARTRGCDA